MMISLLSGRTLSYMLSLERRFSISEKMFISRLPGMQKLIYPLIFWNAISSITMTTVSSRLISWNRLGDSKIRVEPMSSLI